MVPRKHVIVCVMKYYWLGWYTRRRCNNHCMQYVYIWIKITSKIHFSPDDWSVSCSSWPTANGCPGTRSGGTCSWVAQLCVSCYTSASGVTMMRVQSNGTFISYLMHSICLLHIMCNLPTRAGGQFFWFIWNLQISSYDYLAWNSYVWLFAWSQPLKGQILNHNTEDNILDYIVFMIPSVNAKLFRPPSSMCLGWSNRHGCQCEWAKFLL